VPAIVEDLTAFNVGETPGMLLGRQVMQRLGTITFDFPNASIDLQAASPTAAPAGATEAPLLLVDLHVLLIPSVPVSLDGSNTKFYAWLGGSYGAAFTVAKKEYLKSNHLPRELEPLDDPSNGLKMVYIEQAKLGELPIKGVGGLVLATAGAFTLTASAQPHGGGPGGLATAIRLKQLAALEGGEVSVVVLEKGSEPGAHILSGACLEPRALAHGERLEERKADVGQPRTASARKRPRRRRRRRRSRGLCS